MMSGHEDNIILVALSVLVAIFASFTALSLSERIMVADAGARRWWILAAALALGGGTWSMHFVGMLAMNMPTFYDIYLTLFSLMVPVVVSALGLAIVSRFGAGPAPLLSGGFIVGLGIVAMHYTGMAALQMPGVRIIYDQTLVGASIVLALVAATGALWLAFRKQDASFRAGASVVMGGAISGMHYTGMAAAQIIYTRKTMNMVGTTIAPDTIAIGVIGAAFFLLLLALVTAYFDHKLATLTAREAEILVKSEERYRALIESASDIIGILDYTGTFIYESSSAFQVLGYRSDELVGKRLADFVTSDRSKEAQRFLKSVLDQPASSTVVELALVNKAGERRDFELVATNLLHLPTIGGIVVNLRDVTQRTQMVAQLETLSETDLLTGAFNRRGFTRLAERQFELARRDGRRMTIVMLDVDHFKNVNDQYGHAAGDLVLAKIADVCRAPLLEGELLGRMGGEEFVILIAHGDLSQARNDVSALRGAVAAATVSTIRGPVSITASFGVAYVDPRTTELVTALADADAALYRAKNEGRDCIRFAA